MKLYVAITLLLGFPGLATAFTTARPVSIRHQQQRQQQKKPSFVTSMPQKQPKSSTARQLMMDSSTIELALDPQTTTLIELGVATMGVAAALIAATNIDEKALAAKKQQQARSFERATSPPFTYSSLGGGMTQQQQQQQQQQGFGETYLRSMQREAATIKTEEPKTSWLPSFELPRTVPAPEPAPFGEAAMRTFPSANIQPPVVPNTSAAAASSSAATATTTGPAMIISSTQTSSNAARTSFGASAGWKPSYGPSSSSSGRAQAVPATTKAYPAAAPPAYTTPVPAYTVPPATRTPAMSTAPAPVPAYTVPPATSASTSTTPNTASYMESIGGSSSAGFKKSYGPSSSGKPKAVTVNAMGSSYLNAMSSGPSAPSPAYPAAPATPSYTAPAPVTPAYTATTSTTPTTASYMDSIGGGSSAAAGLKKSYGPSSGKPKVVTANAMGSSYLNSMGTAASAPSPSYSAAPAVTPPSTIPAAAGTPAAPVVTENAGSYMDALGGGISSSGLKRGYGPSSGKPKVVTANAMGSSYLNSMGTAASPPSPSYSAAPPVTSPSTAATPAYTAPVVTESATAANAGSYMDALGGGISSSGLKRGYGPSSGKPKVVTANAMGSSYLNSMGTAASPPSPSYPAAPAVSSPSTAATPAYTAPIGTESATAASAGTYMDALGGGISSSGLKRGYGPSSGKPKVVTANAMGSSYLNSMGTAASAPSPSYPAAPVAPAYATVPSPELATPSKDSTAEASAVSYMDALGGGFSDSGLKKSYGPSSGKPKVVTGNAMGNSYLNSMGSFVSAPSPSFVPPAPETTRVVAPSEPLYQPPMETEATNAPPAPVEYIANMNGPAPSTTAYSEPPAPAYTSPVAESATAVGTGSYMDALGGGGGAFGLKTSYGPSSGRPKVVIGNNALGSSYLASMGSAPASSSTSYSAPPAPAFTPAPVATPPADVAASSVASSVSYMDALGGGGGAAAKKASHGPSTGMPKVVTSNALGSSYLSSMGTSSDAPAPSYAPVPATPAYTATPTPGSTASSPYTGSYIEALGGGGSDTAKKTSYGPSRGKPKVVTGNALGSSYLSAMGNVPSVPSPSYAPPPAFTAAPAYSDPPAVDTTSSAASDGSYLESFAGGSASGLNESYGPSSGKPKVVVVNAPGGSYLASMGSMPIVSSPSYSPPPTPAYGSALTEESSEAYTEEYAEALGAR